MGATLLVFGACATFVLQWAQDDGGVIYRWNLLGPATVGWGLGMFLVPGSSLTLAEVRDDWSRRIELLTGCRWFHVLFWLVLACAAPIVAEEWFGFEFWPR